jgi:hypothetical protein
MGNAQFNVYSIPLVSLLDFCPMSNVHVRYARLGVFHSRSLFRVTETSSNVRGGIEPVVMLNLGMKPLPKTQIYQITRDLLRGTPFHMSVRMETVDLNRNRFHTTQQHKAKA